MELTTYENVLKIDVDTAIAIAALVVSLVALVTSVYFWRRQFRPIVTAAVRTASAGSNCIAYKLEVLNSGTIPARNIVLHVDKAALSEVFGADATPENQTRWLACFTREKRITVLHNGSRVSCSFGTTQSNDRGFWKTRAQISMTIQYEGWFGEKYVQAQTVEVVDSASFTGYMWGEGDA
ncbi:hypothetical protein VB145_14010 [Xanthomonas arboricola]|uniref:hypothetical protein n=1 Tax=Xanthomonas arboricola TaxID=56448 RepID=UPI001187619B|nr:hypothetical protein [Xanthomonas arboricola]MEA5149516.1 hypothetical protein [Xanthomonas arboricola]UQP96327.1 hypothetical protein KP728_11710 [Xanthomonas arboricola pv. juglandis]UQQ02554.1 hypothetical protein KP727_00740 [Xanthomonas arboricola pv. juglandis]CAD7387725.1 hypothetical protein X12_004425 [Xanthomonas arboricola]